MNRRKFLQQVSLLTGGLIFAAQTPLSAFTNADKKLKGRIIAKGKGLAGVVISDGYKVLATDKKGRFEFQPHPDAVTLFISTPAGYEFLHEKKIARQYKQVNSLNFKKEIKFELKPLDKNDNEHQFIIWADPQVKNEKDLKKMFKHSVPDVQKVVADAGPDALLHGITVGDIVWDKLDYFPEYDKAVAQMGIPFFQCLGNHDMDLNSGDDAHSDVSFVNSYGPTYYSFNRGKAHYVVLDNVRYLGKDKNYDGYIQQHQLDWLAKDLAYVPADNLVIICMHIPLHSGTKNRDMLYDLIKGRNVHVMSGHTHYNENIIENNIYEHNHGTVCGAWWTGPICGDGTPNGYGVYTVKGSELSWHYKSTGKDPEHQMSIAASDYNAEQKQILVNIWNYDDAWKTAFAIDGKPMGALEQFEGFDPLAYKTLLGPALPAIRGFAEPRKTNHMFKALVPVTAKNIQVTVTDRFGKIFTNNQSI